MGNEERISRLMKTGMDKEQPSRRVSVALSRPPMAVSLMKLTERLMAGPLVSRLLIRPAFEDLTRPANCPHGSK